VATLEEIRIRDPFILPVPEEGLYYLFGTTGHGFDAHVSGDLRQWQGPVPAFRPPAGFWADRDFWAPEVHIRNGVYHLLASFKAEARCRGTQILAAARPGGPYAPHSDGPVTPADWECLDGTLHIDGDGRPWMVFCHEWLQVGDGEVCALPLSPDLRRAAGDPRLLFRASEAPWTAPVGPSRPPHGAPPYVTDGPWLHRAAGGELLMLWSSFGSGGYAVGLARAASGRVTGPWIHDSEPLFADDGGHAMLFRDFRGVSWMALHVPNRSPDERARLLPVNETAGRLLLGRPRA